MVSVIIEKSIQISDIDLILNQRLKELCGHVVVVIIW
jgi:hypothetical protein